MKKFKVMTLGCKVNQYESDGLSQYLRKSGWHSNADETCTDLCIINTCTVTQKASMQSRQAIRKAVRKNPEACIIVTGCYAQTEPSELEKITGVDYVIGHSDKHKIPSMLSKIAEHKNSHPVTICHDIAGEKKFANFPCPGRGGRTRAFLKIQDGCNNFCTYCIVPYARGRSRSMPAGEVLHNINTLQTAGFKEVVLTGIHLGYYGLDFAPPSSLVEMLRQIHETRPMDRVRLSSIEPHEITEEMICLVASSGVFCHHFHIPLQSGDDSILQRMHRPYSGAFFKELVQKIHGLLPDAAIGADILVGFPGETDDAFENTYNLINEMPVTYLHVFPFSSRSGTPAAGFPDQVEHDVVKTRCRRMRELGIAKKKLFYKKNIGKISKVLIEGKRDRDTGHLKGTTHNYIPILLQGEDYLKESIVNVRIESVSEQGRVCGLLFKG
ncbi:MAG: tRNA (N(6)-L-threonylcarbamoyladenosine(37)-C(2))-methylthiotransferase MtaB [Desulfobacteraceae bacterium 4572_123]|nr:MAG: tRNA (N(6)-L-threonylcarbamoyladenosine(37)-C(2))-methylthiotransferase MtaB [Desulfobacteraceae bacterium 4572_123]